MVWPLTGGKVALLVSEVTNIRQNHLRRRRAASYGRPDTHGPCRIDVFDHEGKTAMHLAAEIGSQDVCKILLAKNAFINSKTKLGWTALHYAAASGHAELCQFLIKTAEAMVNANTMKKQTALHLAALKGHSDACKAGFFFFY